MKVCDVVSKIPNIYVITIDEYKGLEHTGRRCVLGTSSAITNRIPYDMWNAEVNTIVPYRDKINIEIQAK